ncbi:MAG: DHHA1 domain-containing protein [Desulfurococcales archaeon]|nr:DHHA1 domain-containing protein [Desulfurococcales archaeon]
MDIAYKLGYYSAGRVEPLGVIYMVDQRVSKGVGFHDNPCIVSHDEDIDGIGSAAAVIKITGTRCVYLTGYFMDKWLQLGKKIRARCREKGAIELLVADLNPSLEMIDVLDRSLAGCVGKKVIWVDHHVWSGEVLSRVESLGYIETYINRSMTSTENMINYLGLRENAEMNLIAYLSRDTDYGLYRHPLSEPLTDVIRYSLYRKSDTGFLIKLARKFSRGIVWDYEIESIWIEAKREKEKAIEDARRSVVMRNIKGYKALFMLVDPMISSKIAIREAQTSNYDIAFVVYKNGSVTIARGSRDINCAEIAMRLGGGGHQHIAGAQIGRESVNRGLEYAIKYISERL